MSDTNDQEPKKKGQWGGYRPGSGGKPGNQNAANKFGEIERLLDRLDKEDNKVTTNYPEPIEIIIKGDTDE